MAKPPGVARGAVARRKRSESDRKKHAGWRDCPRCGRSVSTNGRNFYHHMHKCDPAFFADKLARFEPRPSSGPASASAASTRARAPPRSGLSDAQHALFVQQLCFLRVYSPAADAAFRALEAASGGRWGTYSSRTFADIQARQARARAGGPSGQPGAHPRQPLQPHPGHPQQAPQHHPRSDPPAGRASYPPLLLPRYLPPQPTPLAYPPAAAPLPRMLPSGAPLAHSPGAPLAHSPGGPLVHSPGAPLAPSPGATLARSPGMHTPELSPGARDNLMAFAHAALHAGHPAGEPQQYQGRAQAGFAFLPQQSPPQQVAQSPQPHRRSAPAVLQPLDVNRSTAITPVAPKPRPSSAPASSPAPRPPSSSSMSIFHVVNN